MESIASLLHAVHTRRFDTAPCADSMAHPATRCTSRAFRLYADGLVRIACCCDKPGGLQHLRSPRNLAASHVVIAARNDTTHRDLRWACGTAPRARSKRDLDPRTSCQRTVCAGHRGDPASEFIDQDIASVSCADSLIGIIAKHVELVAAHSSACRTLSSLKEIESFPLERGPCLPGEPRFVRGSCSRFPR